FLQAIAEAPGDDAPRLVYADWLEDRGADDRAEFIRLQCELAKMDEDDPRRPGLAGRQRVLLAKHGKAWTEAAIGGGELPGAWKAFRIGLAFRRGFLEAWALLSARDFLHHAQELFERLPLRRLLLDGGPEDEALAALASSP